MILWVRIPPVAWMFVCCEWCVLSGRGLCDELINRPEESYRLWCVVMCDLETSWMRTAKPTGGCCAKNKQTNKLVGFLCGFDRASSLICRNKMPTRCNRWFLLQILLLAQHVSGTIMPIIRSSSPQTGHITLSSTPYRQLENQSTKYDRQQQLV